MKVEAVKKIRVDISKYKMLNVTLVPSVILKPKKPVFAVTPKYL